MQETYLHSYRSYVTVILWNLLHLRCCHSLNFPGFEEDIQTPLWTRKSKQSYWRADPCKASLPSDRTHSLHLITLPTSTFNIIVNACLGPAMDWMYLDYLWNW